MNLSLYLNSALLEQKNLLFENFRNHLLLHVPKSSKNSSLSKAPWVEKQERKKQLNNNNYNYDINNQINRDNNQKELDRLKIPYFHISPEDRDVSLETRVIRANTIYRNDKNTYILSVHANAGGGKGVEGFTTLGHTDSDRIGEIILSNLENDLVGQRMRFDRTDGDRDKEVNYYILRKPAMSAFLLECGFMDNQSDYNNLWDRDYLDALVQSLVKSIKYIYENQCNKYIIRSIAGNFRMANIY